MELGGGRKMWERRGARETVPPGSTPALGGVEGTGGRRSSSDLGVPPGATPEPLLGHSRGLSLWTRDSTGRERGSCTRFGPGLVEQSRLRCLKQWLDPTSVLNQHRPDSKPLSVSSQETELLSKGAPAQIPWEPTPSQNPRGHQGVPAEEILRFLPAK